MAKIVLEATGAANFDEVIKFLVALCKLFPGSNIIHGSCDIYCDFRFDANTPIEEIKKEQPYHSSDFSLVNFRLNNKPPYGDLSVSVLREYQSDRYKLWASVNRVKYKKELDLIFDVWKKTVTGKVDSKISTFPED